MWETDQHSEDQHDPRGLSYPPGFWRGDKVSLVMMIPKINQHPLQNILASVYLRNKTPPDIKPRRSRNSYKLTWQHNKARAQEFCPRPVLISQRSSSHNRSRGVDQSRCLLRRSLTTAKGGREVSESRTVGLSLFTPWNGTVEGKSSDVRDQG